jgi:GTP cyclohydrolase II
MKTAEKTVETRLPTRWGTFRALAYQREMETALVLMMGDATGGAPPLVRIHSQCFTGEILGSLRCDCAGQLESAMQAIAREGRGLLIYEYQEGRGIGLTAKLQAYALQDAGLDTVEANHALGFAADCRNFALPAAILNELGIGRIRLLSNNPEKSRALRAAGIKVVARVRCEAEPTPYSLPYLRTKHEKMGHVLSLRKP